MLTNRTLARINNRPREVGRLPLLAVGGGTLVLAALLYVFGILPPLRHPRRPRRRRAARPPALRDAEGQDDHLPLLQGQPGRREQPPASPRCRKPWRAWPLRRGSGACPFRRNRPKAGEVAPTPEREPARVGLLPTPGIKADVPVWGIEAGDGSIFFFPEGTLLYRNDRYEPVSYNALKMTLSSGRFFEEGDLSSDATVVETVWRFSRPDGSPDPRHRNDNFEIPVVLYNLLDMKGPSGLDLRLMVSNRRAAARFARTFGARDLREKRRKDSPPGAASGKASGRLFLERAEGVERRSTAPRKTWRGRPGSPGRARPSGSRRGLRRSRSGPPTGSWRAPTTPTRSPAWNRK